jgi:hypothetical protein
LCYWNVKISVWKEIKNNSEEGPQMFPPTHRISYLCRGAESLYHSLVPSVSFHLVYLYGASLCAWHYIKYYEDIYPLLLVRLKSSQGKIIWICNEIRIVRYMMKSKVCSKVHEVYLKETYRWLATLCLENE